MHLGERVGEAVPGSRWAVAVLGVALTAVVLGDSALRTTPIVTDVLQDAVPLVVSLAVAGYGIELGRGDPPPGRAATVAGWTAIGAVSLATIATWSLYVQLSPSLFAANAGYVLLVGTTVGAGTGTVVGRYLVRQRADAREAGRAREAIEASIDGVAIVDEDRFVEVNRAFAELFGYDDPETLVGDDWRECYPDETVAKYEEDVLETVADEGEWRGEMVGERRDGTEVPHEISVTGMETGAFVAVVRDVTERVERDRRLEAIHDGNRAFQRAGTVEAVAEETVATAHEVLGEPLTALWLYDDGGDALVPAAAADPAREFAAEAGLESLPTYESGSAEMEVFRSGDPTVFEEYRTTENVTVPEVPLGTTLFAPVGEYGLLAVGSPAVRELSASDRRLVDILVGNARSALERIDRERELVEREQRLRTVVENMPVILFTVDRDRKLALLEGTAVDDADVDVGRMVDRPVRELFGDSPAILDAIDRAFEGEAVESTVDYFGNTYQAHYQPIGDDESEGNGDGDGEVERVIGIGVDVTERRERERGIEALQDVSQDLMTAASAEEIGALVVETARRVLDRPLTGYYAYREDDDVLVPATQSDDATDYLESLGIEERRPLGNDTPAMRAFRSGEMTVTNPAERAGEDGPEVPIRSRLLAPVGDHGLLVVAAEEPDAFDDVEWHLVRILSNTAGAAFDRVERERELAEREQRLRTVVENMPVVLFAVDRGRTITLQEGKGLETVDADVGEIVGASVDEVFADAPAVLDAVDRSLDGESVDVTVDLWGNTYQVYYQPIGDGEVERVIGVAVDVTGRRERERGIEALQDVSQDLMTAESVEAVGSLAVETAHRVLDRPLTAFYAFRPEEDALVPVVRTDAAAEYLEAGGVDRFRTFEGDTAGMKAFRDGEMVVVDPSTRSDTTYPELPLRSRLFAPIGDHGLLVVAGEEEEAFSGVEWQLVRILSNNARAALDRVKRDLELGAREQRLRTIVENVPIVLFALDDEGRFTLSEGRSLGGIGFEPGEVVGQEVSAVFGPGTEITEISRRALDGENVDEVVSFAGHTFEVWYQQVDAGEWSGGLGGADAEADAPSVIGVAMDVTEREQRREGIEALHDATRRMMQETDRNTIAKIAVETAERALNLPITGVWIRNEAGTRLDPVEWSDASAAAFDEFPSFEPGESLSWKAYESGETMVVDDLSSRQRRHNPDTDLRSEIIVPIGEYGVLNSGSMDVAAFDETDVLLAQLLAANTRAALERAERETQLHRQTDQMEFFNSILRHDVLNAMTVIRSRGEILAERTEGDDERFARTIVDWCDDVTDIVGRVRTVLETLTDDDDRDLEVVDLAEVAAHETSRVDDTYPDVAVETDLTDDLRVFADELLADVVGNLVTNAIEHNDADGLGIRVTGDRRDDQVVLRVADDGSGVPDDRKDAIFRRGETGHAKSTGSGFGLFFVDAMIEEYGGSIRVEDNDPQGAVFVVTLPAA